MVGRRALMAVLVGLGLIALLQTASVHQSTSGPLNAPPVGRKADPLSGGSALLPPAAGNRLIVPPTPESKMPAWHGTACLEGSGLTHPKFTAKCRALPPRVELGTVHDVAAAACAISANASVPGRCAQYAAGQFDGPLTVEEAVDVPPCDLKPLDGVVRFTGRPGSEVMHVDRCGFAGGIDRSVALRKLVLAAAGRGVLFSGDSMMRQLFLAVIALLRGEDAFIADHYFHVDAVYVLTASGHDLLAPIAGNKVSTGLASRRVGGVPLEAVFASHFRGYSGAPAASGSETPSGKILLAMMFNWETKPSVHRREFVAMKPSLHIAAFMYWWQNKDPISDLNPYLDTLAAHEAATANQPSRFVWVTTPWTSPKLFGGVEHAVRQERNQRMLSWISRRESMTAARGRRDYSVLDYAAIADAKHMSKTRDGIHYGCILTPKWPDAVTGMKDNGVACRDPMNRAVAAYLIHAL